MRSLLQTLREPVAPPPARPSRMDVALALLGALTLLAETWMVDAWPMRAPEVFLSAVLVAVLPFRRTHPFGAFTSAFGAIIASQWINHVLAAPTQGMSSGAYVLLLPYALARHGRGPQVVAGACILFIVFTGSVVTGELPTAGDAVGAWVVMHFPLVVGLGMRTLDGRRRRDVAHAQLLERQLLARELHDTVAHRVTAITLQAQAARAVLERQPQATRAALDAIESEARIALAELRALLGTLRNEDAPLRPVGGMQELEELVRAAGPRVHLDTRGDAVLSPALEHAIHRVVRESLHNVEKHGRGVTRVDVKLEARGGAVVLTVTDDGEPVRAQGSGGFGIIGMRERAAQLGGRLEAGPLPGRGWQVLAELPAGEGGRP